MRERLPYDPARDDTLYHHLIYPRLNNHYDGLLRTIARRKGLPHNVLARMLIIEGLDKLAEDIKQQT